MKRLVLIIFILVIVGHNLLSQTFTGNSTDKSYKCSLKINKDSSIIFIYDDPRGYVFCEHEGKIHKINDTLFHVSCTLTYGQFIQMSWNSDSMRIQMDEPILKLIDSITVKYKNGQVKKFLIAKNLRHICFRTDKSYVMVTTNHKNQITNRKNNFIIPFRSDASFISGEKEEFDVIIKGNSLKTTGSKTVLQTGHFKLIKNKATK